MVRPTNQFCCGCTLTFGARVILLVHVTQNVLYLLCATSNVLLRYPTFGVDVSLGTQTFNAGVCLSGLPFIFAAFWGISHKLEQHVRLYLVYLVLTCAIDLLYVLAYLLVADTCHNLPTVLAEHGGAWACGQVRIFTLAFALMLMSYQAYAIYIIWSMCEDIRHGSSVECFDELLATKGHEKKAPGPKSGHESFFGAPNKGTYPITYGGTTPTPGVAGCGNIFGTAHDTNFPPTLPAPKV